MCYEEVCALNGIGMHTKEEHEKASHTAESWLSVKLIYVLFPNLSSPIKPLL